VGGDIGPTAWEKGKGGCNEKGGVVGEREGRQGEGRLERAARGALVVGVDCGEWEVGMVM